MQTQLSLLAPLDEGALSFIQKGQGTTLVFLHGIGSSASSWRPVLALVPPDQCAIAWNAPGYPPSAALPMEWPIASDYAERLKQLLDFCHADQVHLIGHSLGCLIAARFARLYRERVKTLTFASCALGHAHLPQAERDRLLQGRITDIEELGPQAMAQKRGPRLLSPGAPQELIQMVVDNMGSVDAHGYAQAARMLSTGDLIGDIAALEPGLPVQFIYGSADVITPPQANLRAAHARPIAPVKVLEGAGHACYIEQPEAFMSAVEGYVSTHA